MKAVYMNWRSNREDTGKHEFEDFNLLTAVFSALKMRRDGYNTKLYGDPFTYRFMEKFDLLDAWDEVDASSLDKQIDRQKYDVSYFFNIAKFFALYMEAAPVMLMDIDLILWKDLSAGLAAEEAVFTHWEKAYPPTEWYCSREDLKAPKGYSWNPEWDFALPATNTSLMYIKDNVFKNNYCEHAFRFMHRNFFPNPKKIRSEIYFVEQRLFLMCLKNQGLLDKTSPVIDTEWDPSIGAFTKKDERLGWWSFFMPKADQYITHTWIAKSDIEKNIPYRNYYCCKLLYDLRDIAPEFAGKLEKIPVFSNYFKRMERHRTLDELLCLKDIKSRLY